MRLVDCLERADIVWYAIGGVAVNHWATEPMVTEDLDFVVVADDIDRAVALLEQAGFQSERFESSVNFKGRSKVRLQLSTEAFYRDYPGRAVAADVHGILLRVASLRDTLAGKIKAWSEPGAVRASASRIWPTSSGWWRRIPSCGASFRPRCSRTCRGPEPYDHRFERPSAM